MREHHPIRAIFLAVIGTSGDTWREWRRVATATRARDWLHFVLLPLGGDSLRTLCSASTARVVASAAAAALLWAGVYLINSLSDVEVDGHVGKNALVQAGSTTLQRAGRAVPVLLAGACCCAGSVGLVPALAALLAAAAGIVYSVGPRLKRRPVIGTLSNVAIFTPGLFLGVTDQDSLARAWWLVVPFSVLLVQNQIVHEVVDAGDDAAGRLLTTYRWGGRPGVAVVLVLVSLGGALALVARSPATLTLTLALSLLLPVPSLVVVARSNARARATRFRLLHRYYALAVGACFWVAGAPEP